MARRIFANVLEELSLRRREAARPSPRTNYVWSACTHERFSGAVRPEPLRSPPAARDILENRPNRKTRIARGRRLLRLCDPSFRDRVVRAHILGVMVDGHRTVQTPERASPGECGNLETFYTTRTSRRSGASRLFVCCGLPVAEFVSTFGAAQRASKPQRPLLLSEWGKAIGQKKAICALLPRAQPCRRKGGARGGKPRQGQSLGEPAAHAPEARAAPPAARGGGRACACPYFRPFA